MANPYYMEYINARDEIEVAKLNDNAVATIEQYASMELNEAQRVSVLANLEQFVDARPNSTYTIYAVADDEMSHVI